MKDISYFSLRALIYDKEHENEVQFSMEILADSWHYSKQNVKKKLKKYEENHILVYTPGKGRGNLSTLRFSQDFHSEVIQALTNSVKNNDIKFALQLAQLDIPQEWFTPFLEEIQTLFSNNSTKDDNIIRFMINRKIVPLDPNNIAFHLECFLVKQISDTLVDYAETEDQYTSSVAIDWSHDENYTKWAFKLRRNIYFHNGKKLTADDVSFTFKEAAKGATGKWMLQNLIRIDCENDYTLCFNFQKPEPLFLKLATHYALVIRPAFSQTNKFIGCGPFQLAESKDTYVCLKSFPKYFKEGPLVDAIEFWVLRSSLKKWLILPQEKNSYETTQASEIAPVRISRSGAAYLVFNRNKENSVDNYLIEAMKLIFDVKSLVKDLYENTIPEAYSYFNNYSSVNLPPKIDNESEILKNLRLSSYDGATLTLAMYNHSRLNREDQWFKEKAAAYGIPIEIKTYGFEDEYYAKDISVEADIALGTDVAVTDSEIGYLDFISNETLLFQHFIDPAHSKQLTTLTDEYRQCLSEEDRQKQLQTIENYITQKNLLFYLYHPIKDYDIHSYINGIEFDPNGNLRLNKLWW